MEWPKITKDTPIEEVKRIHQQIWDYAIEYGHKPFTPYVYDCICCVYDNLYGRTCNFCPILWPINDDGGPYCCSPNGLYLKWSYASGDEQTELARQIRDLPWKFEQKFDS